MKAHGTIEGFAGSMFCGKTSALLARVRRAELAGLSVVLFKPRIDDRYEPEMVCTHDGARREAVLANVDQRGTAEILVAASSSGAEVVGIEEAQFFSANLVQVCVSLRRAGKRVVWAGLDMDYRGEPFGPVPQLMAIGAVMKLTAVCQICGDDATHTFRRTGEAEQVVVGGPGHYEARCFPCWARGTA